MLITICLTMRHKPNLTHLCEIFKAECEKADHTSNPHHKEWYEYNCKLADRHCPKKMPIDTTLPMFLMFSAMFVIVLRFKPKTNKR